MRVGDNLFLHEQAVVSTEPEKLLFLTHLGQLHIFVSHTGGNYKTVWSGELTGALTKRRASK